MKQLTLDEVYPVREPCHRPCRVEWCSLKCFLNRGYMRGKDGKWLKREDGSIIIDNHPLCDWVPKGE